MRYLPSKVDGKELQRELLRAAVKYHNNTRPGDEPFTWKETFIAVALLAGMFLIAYVTWSIL